MFRFFCLFYVFSGRNKIQHFIIIIMQIRIFKNIQIEINGVCTQYVLCYVAAVFSHMKVLVRSFFIVRQFQILRLVVQHGNLNRTK